MEDLIQLIFKTYGIVGLLIMAPFAALVFVWRDYKRIEKDTSDRISIANTLLVEAQKQRVADAQAITNKLIEMVGEQSSLNKETNLTLNRIGDMLSVRHERR